MSLLVHSCCGPCLTGSLPPLKNAVGEETLVAFWDNPNIHPYLEYRERGLSFLKVTQANALDVLYGSRDYGLDRFLATTAGKSGPARCEACFRMRLKATATCAAEKGFSSFTTTLLISPYQDHDLLLTVGSSLAEELGVAFLGIDLRPGFQRTFEDCRRLDLYRQAYCGCIFSEFERFSTSKKHTLPFQDRG